VHWFVLVLVVFILCLLIPYHSYQKLVIPLIILSVISLLIVPFFGKTEYNATRTIVLLGFNIQPSEFVKLFLIIYLASVYSKKQDYIDNLSKVVIQPLVLSLFIIVLFVI